MPGISACIISFNEESKISACLASVQGIADEIVVVDSGSTDATIEIANRFGARVIHQPFLGYVEQKDFAAQAGANDWVLSIDCDERLSSELRAAITTAKSALDGHAAYRVSRKTFYIYRWLNHCWYPDRKIRLFDRRQARWGGVNPHDEVIADSGSIADLAGDLLHYSFDSIDDHLDTIARFTEIGAREAYLRGKRASMVDPLVHGGATFIKQYFLKMGCLDGFAGLTACALSGMHAYVKYTKLRLLAMQASNSTK